jgi:hypothetical protein
MASKIFSCVLILVFAAGLGACTKVSSTDHSDDYNIGNKPTAVSSLSVAGGNAPENVVIFDKTVRRIHQFDLTTMHFLRSFEVRHPELDHYVLYGQQGNYIVDFSLKGLTIFNRYNQANHQPIRLFGNPKSVAFNPDTGILIVYDDLSAVGILKLNAFGDVLSSWVGGAIVSGTQSIAAGDLNSAGQLILALSDASVVTIDVDQTLAQKRWVFTRFTTTLADIRWVAPLPQSPQQILVRAATKLALIDVGTQSVLSTYDLNDDVVKVSKFNDPHVLLRDGAMLKIAYAESSQIQVKTLYMNTPDASLNSVLSTNLDLAHDFWSFVDTKKTYVGVFNDLDEARSQRRFRRYQFSSLVVLQEKPVADEAQVDIAQEFIFCLFPSPLGYAVRYDINSDATVEAKLFNKDYIKAN